MAEIKNLNNDELKIQGRLRLKGSDGTLYWGASANSGRLTWDTGKVDVLGLSGQALSLGSGGTTNRLYINTSGNIGIGTTSPSHKLQVAGNIYANGGQIYIDNGYYLSGGDATSRIYLGNDGGNGVQIYTDSTERVRIADGGNVGIGTSSPSKKLHVKGELGIERSDASAVNTISSEGNFKFVAATGYAMTFTSQGSEMVRFYNGNVGIGTTSPSYKLDVVGKIQSSSDIYVGSYNKLAWGNNGYNYLKFSGGYLNMGYTADAFKFDMNSSATKSIEMVGDSNLQILGKSNKHILLTPQGTGNVGIGTNDPAAKLEIRNNDGGSTESVDKFSIRGGNGGNNQIMKVEYLSDAGVLTLGYAGLSNDRVEVNGGKGASGASISMYDGSTKKVAIGTNGNSYFNGGNVGIGTTSPSAMLEVRAADGNTHSLQIGRADNGNYWKFNHAGNDLRIYNTASSGSDILLGVDAGGTEQANKVGIGTATPDFKLDVAGDIGMDGKLYHNGDHNTYIGFSGDTQTFRTGGADRMSITNSGVGIGTTSPDSKVHIEQSKVAINTTNLDNGTAVGLHITYPDTDLTGGEGIALAMGMNGRGRSYIANISPTTNKDASDIAFYNENGGVIGERLRISSSGNVGIGTTSPSQKLHVYGNARISEDIYVGGQILHDDDTDTKIVFSNNNIKFNIGGSQRLELNNNGTVKIGNSANSTYGLRFQRENSSIPQDSHFYSPSNNSPSAFFIEGGYWTGEAAGTVTAANTGRAYYERYFGNGSTNSYKHFGFINTTGSFTSSNLSASLVLKSNGNVGIGTTSPAVKLDVNGTVRVNNEVQFTNDQMRIYRSSNDMRFRTGSSDRMTITTAGNVGIGTTAPAYKLDIAGTQRIVNTGGSETFLVETNYDRVGKFHSTDSGAFLAIQDSNSSANGIGINVVGNTLRLRTSGSDHLYVASDGDVGIGTSSPGQKLHVYGKLKLEQANGATVLSGDYGYLKVSPTNNYGVLVENNSSASKYFSFGVPGDYGQIRYKENTGSAISVNATGVGIGTATPDSLLEISSSSGGDFLKMTSTGSGANPIKMIFEKSSSEQGVIEYNRNGDLELYNTDGDGGVLISGSASADPDLYVGHNSNVGIGTSSPSQKLHVKDTSGSNALVAVRVENNLNYGELGTQSGYVRLLSEGYLLYAGSTSSTYFYNGGSVVMSSHSSGNVGIGTTSPTTKLHLEGSTPVLQLRETSGTAEAGISINHAVSGNHYNWFVGTIDGDARKFTIGATVTNGHSTSTAQAAASLFTVNQNGGNVGIGTSSPTQKLHVAGNIKTTGWIGSGSSNYITFDDTNNHIDFYANGVHVARMEADGDLHIKGDVIAFSDIF